MTTIRISYDPDLSKIGTLQDVPADEARLLVRRGRATYVQTETASSDDARANLLAARLAQQQDALQAANDVAERQRQLADAIARESTSLDLDDDAS